MNVQLRCDAARPRAWIAAAAAAIAADHHDVCVDWVESGRPVPADLTKLFRLEHMLLHASGTSGAAPLSASLRATLAPPTRQPDVVIDMTGGPRGDVSPATSYLRPLYNGAAGEDAVLDAILAGDLPVIDIVDSTGRVIDRGHPSAEAAAGLSGGLETVMARTVTLLRAVLSGRVPAPTTIALPVQRQAPTSALRYVARGLAGALAKRVYHLLCYAPQWHIGWRLTDGDGVWQTSDLSGRPWQRLMERPHCFNADPFPITWNGRTFVFFEELDHRTNKGVIAAVEFNDQGPVGEILPVLEEPWHLSYPFLIEDGDELWMIPESSTQLEVNLYRCVGFPGQWEHHATLLSGVEFADATITRHQGRFYMFGVSRDGGGGYSDTLSIYHAERLTGPWLPHAQNPIMIDRANARPGGHFVQKDGRLWRPVQDCTHGYGAALGLVEITELSPTTFRQVTHHTIPPSAQWPGRKLHTLNRCGRLEVIDGSRIQPKINTILFK